MEEDKLLTFGNDVSGVGTLGSRTPASTLGPGAPDSATADTLIKKVNTGEALYLEDDEGNYKAEVYLAGSVPVVFCIYDSSQCGKSGKYCCDSGSRVCLTKDPNASGFCP